MLLAMLDTTTPRPRGRPNRSENEINQIKARVIECAYLIFRNEGFEAVSMRRLAADIGCTVMTVYKYFPRKIDILKALWTRVFSDLFDQLDNVAANQPDPHSRLRQVARAYVQFWLDHRDHYFLVFMSSNVEQSDVSVFVQDDALLARFQIFHRSIAEASTQPLDEAQLELRTQLLLCGMHGIAHNLITISGYTWMEPIALIDATTSAILAEEPRAR